MGASDPTGGVGVAVSGLQWEEKEERGLCAAGVPSRPPRLAGLGSSDALPVHCDSCVVENSDSGARLLKAMLPTDSQQSGMWCQGVALADACGVTWFQLPWPPPLHVTLCHSLSLTSGDPSFLYTCAHALPWAPLLCLLSRAPLLCSLSRAFLLRVLSGALMLCSLSEAALPCAAQEELSVGPRRSSLSTCLLPSLPLRCTADLCAVNAVHVCV